MIPHHETDSPASPISPTETQPSLRTRKARAYAAWPWWSIASLWTLVLIAIAGVTGIITYNVRTPPPAKRPTVVLVTVTRQSEPTRAVVADATSTPIAWPSLTRYVRVINTQGLNLRIRSAPSTTAETIKLVPDQMRLIVTGDGRQADGQLWWPVRDPSDNKEGWVVGAYIVPDTGP